MGLETIGDASTIFPRFNFIRYSYLLIQNWIRFHRWRYTLDKKRKYLCNMIHILPYELVIHTLSFL
jgi:hypothetical protein